MKLLIFKKNYLSQRCMKFKENNIGKMEKVITDVRAQRVKLFIS